MTDFRITPENVVNAAAVVIETWAANDRIASKESVNNENAFEALKRAFHNFKNPFEGRAPGEYSPLLLFDEHLSELLNSTKAVFDGLTEESKKFLSDEVNEKQKNFKPYHRNIRAGKAGKSEE